MDRMTELTDLTERLRGCPFCGGEAKLASGRSSTVQCQNDQCIIGDPAPFNDFSHRQDAIAAWNKRPTLETLTQENARLRETGWRDIESAPKDGTKFMVWADGYEWPEVVLWQDYDPEDAEEIGDPGYWRYAEDLLDDATDSCEPDLWTHWMPLPPAPARKALGGGDE